METKHLTEDRLTVRLPAGAALAIERAAIQARVRPSELMRRAMSDGLRSWGLQFATEPWRNQDL